MTGSRISILLKKHLRRFTFAALTRFLSRVRSRAAGTSLPHEWVPPGHFYSPLPSVADINAALARSARAPEVLGVEMREREQRSLLERLAVNYADLPFAARPKPGVRYHYDNPNYSYSDAIFLSLVLREFQPRQIIEVGCGNSTLVTLDTVERFIPHDVSITLVEPYPAYVRHLLGAEIHDRSLLMESKLQNVPLSKFQRLQENDVLFVDSTHVSKAGSDVNHLLFDILPILAPGVLVHVHDVFPRFEYPAHWLQEGRAWNELYMFRAFLQFNSDFEIMLFGPYIVERHESWFAENMPLCLKDPGSSIWIRRSS